MPTQDEEIARHLDDALKSGELQRAKGFGRPMPEDAGWDATPQEFRMAFRILKNSEFAPREIEMLRRRAELGAKIRSCGDAAQRQMLMQTLSLLEQAIALRLESLRASGTL